MLHAGLGLCLAESLLRQLDPDSSTHEIERVVRAYLGLCKANSQEGYVGCAYESLGLVTRCFNYGSTSDLVARCMVWGWS